MSVRGMVQGRQLRAWTFIQCRTRLANSSWPQSCKHTRHADTPGMQQMQQQQQHFAGLPSTCHTTMTTSPWPHHHGKASLSAPMATAVPSGIGWHLGLVAAPMGWEGDSARRLPRLQGQSKALQVRATASLEAGMGATCTGIGGSVPLEVCTRQQLPS